VVVCRRAGTLRKIVFAVLVDVVDDRLLQRLLVAFQRQNIVPAAVNNLRCNRFLRPHRIDR